jgi:catechol 2,3-dioxygenase-like lactoylglutathione lyase family enzyme
MVQLACPHIHLKAENVDVTSAWYQQVLGAQLVATRRFRGSVEHELNLQGTTLVVHGQLERELPLPKSIQPRFGLDHFGFEVQELDALAAALDAKGVIFVERPNLAALGVRLAVIEAPDGVRIEFIESRASHPDAHES